MLYQFLDKDDKVVFATNNEITAKQQAAYYAQHPEMGIRMAKTAVGQATEEFHQ